MSESELGQEEWKWLTTNEILEQHDIPRYMVYRWGPHLERHGLARKLPGGQRGAWLILPSGVNFLATRKGKVGRPPK